MKYKKSLLKEGLNYISCCCFPFMHFLLPGSFKVSHCSSLLCISLLPLPLNALALEKHVHIKCTSVCTIQAPPSWPPLREGELEVLSLIFSQPWFNHEYVWLNKATTQTDYSWLLLNPNKVEHLVILTNNLFIWGNEMWQFHISELGTNIAFYFSLYIVSIEMK